MYETNPMYCVRVAADPRFFLNVFNALPAARGANIRKDPMMLPSTTGNGAITRKVSGTLKGESGLIADANGISAKPATTTNPPIA